LFISELGHLSNIHQKNPKTMPKPGFGRKGGAKRGGSGGGGKKSGGGGKKKAKEKKRQRDAEEEDPATKLSRAQRR
jgi:hypothetical protein